MESSWAKRRDIPLAILAWLAVVSVVIFFLAKISKALLLLVIAGFLAYALVPVVTFLSKYMPRVLAICIVYLVVLVGIGALLYVLITSTVDQLRLFAHNISLWLSPAEGEDNSPLFITLQRFGISAHEITVASEELTMQAEQLTKSIVPFLSGIFTFMFDMLVVGFMSIYLLLDGSRMVSWLQVNVPRSQQKRVKQSLLALERVIGGYIRGQLLLAIIIGVLIGIGMAIFRVPYALLLGVVAFILAFVPILGTIISGAICVLLALTQGWITALIVLGYFILMHVIEGDILGPRIVGKAVGLHPLVSMVALVVGSQLFGVVGALFASPVAGVLQSILVTIWKEWRVSHSEFFEEK